MDRKITLEIEGQIHEFTSMTIKDRTVDISKLDANLALIDNMPFCCGEFIIEVDDNEGYDNVEFGNFVKSLE